MDTDHSKDQPEVVYGAQAIAKIVFGKSKPDEKDVRRIYYWHARKLLPGAGRIGDTLSLNVPVFRAAMRGQAAE